MAWDLVLAISSITALAVLAYLTGKNLGERIHQFRALMFVTSLTLAVVFGCFFAGNLFWAQAISVSSVAFWSNMTPILTAFAAGLAGTTPGLAHWRRPFSMISLSVIAACYLLIPIVRPIVAPATVIADASWRDGVCLQSHGSTCGAAAAATLLNQRCIDTDEREMIGRCLTSSFGTEPLGLYRGLKLATKRTQISVGIASANPSDWQSDNQLPNVALVRFTDSPATDSIHWLLGPRGEGHAVVVLAQENGEWIIGDPAVGKVRWSDDVFRRRFTGDAIYLTD